MTTPFSSSIVRIRTPAGVVCGAGFLVAERQVITCAHVVADALGLARTTPETPTAAVALDFPLLPEKWMCSARVAFWLPVRHDSLGGSADAEDIAVLEFDGSPPNATGPVQLIAVEELWGHGFRAFGFPRGQDDGVYASGVLRARNAAGWVQIEDVKISGFRVEPGFSGGPVWDEDLGGIVGMAVAAVRAPEVRAAFIIPTALLIRAWPRLGKQAIPPCPYRGLFAFREDDAPFYFGRDRDTARLIEATAKKNLVAVVGASGSGKSSVVAAGLLPCLRREGGWLIAIFRPGKAPFQELALTLLPSLELEADEIDRLVKVNRLADALRQGDVQLRQTVERILHKNPVARRLLLVADQFEELYTLCLDVKYRQRFLDELLATVGPAIGATTRDFTLLLTLRADFLGHALSYRPFADALQDADLKLGPMTRQELQEAVEKPAEQLHVRLEDGLTERILAAVDGSPGQLPLLEFALELLWKEQEDGKLTHAAYDRIGGVEKALTIYAEEVFD
jgi:hypothetical protein